MPTYSQQQRSIAIGTPLGEDVLLLKSMNGTEQLGRLFQFSLQLLSENPDIKFEDLMGQNVTVRLNGPDGKLVRHFNGIISRFSLTGVDGGLASYSATMVPWLWALTRVADCRIFQNKTVPEIIKDVLSEYEFPDVKDSLSGSHRKWEYCVQYRETTFNFLSRLMEQEGIYYFFEHEDGKHTIVLADGPSAHVTCKGYEKVPFHPQESFHDSLTDWAIEKQVLSGAYAHRDFDFSKPKTLLESGSNKPREHAMAEYEVYDYPGEYAEAKDGDAYASIRMQELQCSHTVARGAGGVLGLLPGGTFELTQHPRADQNRAYLVTHIQHQLVSDQFGSGGGGDAPVYQCSVRAIPDDEVFRSTRSTPKPQIAGPQTALVTGPGGEEIHTDAHGRVKVQFHWDRDGKYDENSSCWVRVSQNWAGKKWGAFFLPRVGQEVIIEFLEGDPDQPIVTGRVYNGDAKPPYDLPGEKTKSTLKSNSSKGGKGFNEIRFEDKAGSEQIFIHGQKNLDVRILNDHFEWIGASQHLIVEKDQLAEVKNNSHLTIASDHKQEIGKDQHLKVKGKQAVEVGGSNSLTVKGDMIEVFKANHSEQTTGNYYVKATGVVIEASSGITLKCGGNSVVIDPAGVTVKGTMVTLDGSMTKINSGPGSPPVAGSAGSAVAPAAPDKPEEADKADPGEVEEIKKQQQITRKGKYGAAKVTPFKPAEQKPGEEKKTSWIEIELVDEEDKPVPGAKYRIELPDGSVADGTLDEKGFARVEGFEPGQCKVTFPDLDKEAWEKA